MSYGSSYIKRQIKTGIFMEVHSSLQTFVLGAVTATEVAPTVFLTNKIYKY